MTLIQMSLIWPDLPPQIANVAHHHAVTGNWARFRDYLQRKFGFPLAERYDGYQAAQRGYSPALLTSTDVATEAAQGFPNSFCMERADSVREALESRGMHGIIVDLNTGNAQGLYGYIWSDLAATTISVNGRHRGVLIGATVVDNHHPGGILLSHWIQDLVSPEFAIPGTIPLSRTAF